MHTNRRISLLALTTLAFGLAGCGLGGNLVSPTISGKSANQFRADGVSKTQVLVTFKNKLGAQNLGSFESRSGLRIRRNLSAIQTAVVSINGSPEAAIAKLKADPSVASVEFDRAVTLDEVKVNDSERGKQYALDKVRAGAAWDKTMGSDAVTIAIVDSGLDLDHPDLQAKLVSGINVVEPNTDPMDDVGHGTHVAGIASALTNNSEGIAGLAANCRVMPVKVLGANSGSEATVAEGILWAADHGADVINMSLGFYDESMTVNKAVAYALSKNVVIVATMGNDNVQRKRYPAACEGVIAVGSTDSADKKSSFSNYGDWISVSAPGSAIYSTFPTYPVVIKGTAKYASLSGTSMAAPLVAGLCGLVRSQHQGMAPAEVKKLIESTTADLGDSGFDKYFGHGRIDAFTAVSK